jgi:hypothetical protein
MKKGFQKELKISVVLQITLMILCLQQVSSQTYTPPIGIPAPEFGINETVEHVYGSDDFYTHYIDNTDTNATDANNPNGSAEKPRLTIPKDFTAGSVVEIHGGPYPGISGTYTMNGTSENPVFLRGVGDGFRPRIKKAELEFAGRYFIVENLDFYDKTRIKFRVSAKYGCLRNSEVHNPIGQIGAGNPTVSVTGENMVIYNNEIHDNVKDVDVDCHGVQASNNGYKIWILDNHIYNNGGDGIQACHNCDPGPRYLYIGRNNFHGDKENGIDLKYAQDVIISENKIHGYTHSAETGIVSPIVVGSAGAPTRVWIIFNEIYDATKGIRIEEIDDIWIIGNLIYDITEAGIIPEKVGTRTVVLNNTLYNMQRGISNPWRNSFSFLIFNNIFSDIEVSSINLSSTILEKSEISHNLFWNASSQGENPITGNPQFTDLESLDFSLQESSAAIDVGPAVGGFLYEYFSRYEEDISYDFNREIRPQGNDLDIGAFEFPTGTTPTQYELDVEVDGLGGTVWPAGGKYTDGSVIKLTATPADDYMFDSWSGDLSGSANPATVTMDSDKSILAKFKAQTHYSLTINISGSGNVMRNPDSSYYAPGTMVTLTAVPESGEQFIEWRGSLSGADNPVEITIDDDKEVTAVFTSPLSEEFIVTSIGPYTGNFEATWTAYATNDNIDGVIGFSKSSPSDYDHLSCKVLIDKSGDILVSNGSSYTADQVVSYSAYQNLDFRMFVNLDEQTYTVWVTPEGVSETLLADAYAFHPGPGSIDQVGYRCIKMSFDPVWGGEDGMVVITSFDAVLGLEDNDEKAMIPENYSLRSYPNPFNPGTIVSYHLPSYSHIDLSIYNMLGQKIVTLDRGKKSVGRYSVRWNAIGYAAGVYYSRLETSEGKVLSNRMILLK